MSVEIRERLNRLLDLVENSKDSKNREKVGALLDVIPNTFKAIQVAALVAGKPKLTDLLVRTMPWPKEKVIAELQENRFRTDWYGQICNCLYKLETEGEVL